MLLPADDACSGWQYFSSSMSNDLGGYLSAIYLHSERQTASNKWFIYTALPSVT